jgi:hypothetical protein
VTVTTAATTADESTTGFTPAQLLRQSRDGVISRFGTRFCTYQLSNGWSAIAYVSGDSQADSDLWSMVKSAEQYWRDTLTRIQNDLEAPAGLLLHKSSAGSRVAQLKIDLPNGETAEAICKQGRVGTFVQRLGSWLKGPKEWREFWLGHRLRQLGLPTPLPLACLLRRAGMYHMEGRIVTAFVANALPIDRAIRKLDAARKQHRRSEPLDVLTRRMAGVLRTLGDNKLYHRDLKVSNVLVSNCEDDPQPWLIDLDGVGTESESRGPRFRNMLARLTTSLSASTDLGATQHVRALMHLADHGGATKGVWKVEWKETQSAIRRLQSKQRRGGGDLVTLF